MNLTSFKDLPNLPDLDDKAAVQLSDFLYALAHVCESHYSAQIRRYYRQVESFHREQELKPILDKCENQEDEGIDF